jgi:CHAT domain-containing protein
MYSAFIIFEKDFYKGPKEKQSQFMNFKKQVSRFVILFCLTYAGSFIPLTCDAAGILSISQETDIKSESASERSIEKTSLEIEKFSTSLRYYLGNDDLKNAKIIANQIIPQLANSKIIDSTFCKSSYLVGIYFLKAKKYNDAILYIKQCISNKEKNSVIDIQYLKAVYNLSVVYASNGDIKNYEKYGLESLELYKKKYGTSRPELLLSYIATIKIFQSLKNHDKAIAFTDTALAIANKYPEFTNPSTLIYLYSGMAYSFLAQGDQSKSKIYLDKTKSIYDKFNLPKNNELYLNLLSDLAETTAALGLAVESKAYYEEGMKLAVTSNSTISFHFIRNYCNILAKEKQTAKGVRIFEETIDRAKSLYNDNPKDYFELLYYFAGYLREHTSDMPRYLRIFEQCFDYIKNNPQDIQLKALIYFGYSQALEKAGNAELALELIDDILFPDGIINTGKNASIMLNSLKPEVMTVVFLRIRYRILRSIYKKNQDLTTLLNASYTSELIIATLDKVRINISEEESRIILGDKYRGSYLNTINDFYSLYSKTGESQYLEKAFEYSEKSKVAGLLTSTRELKATQFHIPVNTANYERELQRKLGLLSMRITEETSRENKDENVIGNLKESLLETTRSRDSLILIFEKKYPEYYAIKYNTMVTGLKDIPKLIGRSGNYINYVLSDTILYTFVANSKHQQLIATKIDSSLFGDIKKFRRLLSMPLPSDNFSGKFEQFNEVGRKLCAKLIDPVRSYLISDQICISPDNIISYLPFESIPSTSASPKAASYRDLTYLMNEYDISYAYSATLMAENMTQGYKTSNKLIAFAPSYPEPINIQSVMMSRQVSDGILNDLPFARKEAEYVANLTGGKLYENGDASESVYKRESGNYDIIHLAMHTLLNDRDPMRSTLLFSHPKDSVDDGYLKTYEVYGVPLKAKMVVLSSCNTGAGLLSSGEGIISLARGFIYSGSQSVVMSMWEIEDKSGTDIVEMFYKNLRDGYSKSAALKKARISFLKKADMLRSHPYFWSSLVVYGNNTPIYYSKKHIIVSCSAGAVLLLLLGYYFWRRRYS